MYNHSLNLTKNNIPNLPLSVLLSDEKRSIFNEFGYIGMRIDIASVLCANLDNMEMLYIL